MTHSTALRPSAVLLAALLWCAAGNSEAGAQDVIVMDRPTGPEDVARCEPLQRALTDLLGMAAEISPDTMQDWRTQRILPACRVTASGSALIKVPGEENQVFYYTLMNAGWTRTPDPHDRPNEAAIRLRYEGADCFFTPYVGIRLATPAEFRVNNAMTPPPGESRYNYLAVCVEALPSAP